MKAVYISDCYPLTIENIREIIILKRKYESIILYILEGKEHETFKLNHLDRLRTVREMYKDDNLINIKSILNIDLSNIIDLEISEGNDIYIDDDIAKIYKVNNQNINLVECMEVKEKVLSYPYEYWENIAKEYRKFFVLKVLVYGSASCGKTTLVQDLSKFYNTTYTLEYAREYQEKFNVNDEELDIRDLINIGIGQFNNNKKTIHSPLGNKIFIADTDIMTTSVYLNEYLGNDPLLKSTNEIFQNYIDKENWDIILFLQPDTTYIDDGFRDMRHGNDEERQKMNNAFKKVLDSNKLNYDALTGDYENKFLEAIKIIEKKIKKY